MFRPLHRTPITTLIPTPAPIGTLTHTNLHTTTPLRLRLPLRLRFHPACTVIRHLPRPQHLPLTIILRHRLHFLRILPLILREHQLPLSHLPPYSSPRPHPRPRLLSRLLTDHLLRHLDLLLRPIHRTAPPHHIQ